MAFEVFINGDNCFLTSSMKTFFILLYCHSLSVSTLGSIYRFPQEELLWLTNTLINICFATTL